VRTIVDFIVVVDGGVTVVVVYPKALLVEVVEANEDYCHVVQRPPQQRILYDVLHSQADLLVNVLRFSISDTVPHALYRFLVANLVENAITRHHNEVMVLLDPEALNIWNRNHHVPVPSPPLNLRLYISESPRH